MTVTVTGPILLPNTPDCDYKNGEPPLSADKVNTLVKSFKNYNIIDYEHDFTNKDSPYFLQNVGTPLQVFTNDKEVTFTDVADQEITVPSGTAWLQCEVTDETLANKILEHEIVAYSVSISEKDQADTVYNAYKQIAAKNANKNNINIKDIEKIHTQITTKQRTLIADINDPVMLTVSLVKFPCVAKAKFCKNIKINKEDKNLSEKAADNKTAKETFLNQILTAYKSFKQDKQETNVTTKADEEPDTKPEIKEEEDDMDENQINELIDKKLQEILDQKVEEKVEEAEEQEIEEKVDEKVEETVEESVKPDLETIIQQKIDEALANLKKDDAEPAEKENAEKSSVGVAHRSKTILNHTKQQQPQDSNIKTTETGAKKSMRREEDVIYDLIKGNATANKSNYNNINYEGTGLNTTYANETYLSLLNRQAREVFKASFSEESSNRAILTTNVFSTFVTKLIKEEPIFEDLTYQTGYHGKGYIYRLDNGTYDTEDGHLPAHYYFDSNPEDDVFAIEPEEIQTYTQRRRVTISDRQRLSNVYGDDLVNKVLEISRKKLFRGVYGARIWGDTSLGSDVDMQYKRQDGYLKSAGIQLTSSDFDVDNILNIFDTMFYSLPEEAQITDDYVYYVPSNVRRAFSNYFLESMTDGKFDYVSKKQELYWNGIPIKESPTLNRADLKTALNNENSAIWLTAPSNTHLIVGREAGIETQRNADTSSDTFYETIDTAGAYSEPDYAVTATLTKSEYETLNTAPSP